MYIHIICMPCVDTVFPFPVSSSSFFFFFDLGVPYLLRSFFCFCYVVVASPVFPSLPSMYFL